MTDDGRCALRFERRLAHPAAKVWTAITTIDHLREWFVQILDYDRMQFDLAPGAAVTFPAKAEHGGTIGHGTVTRFDPPKVVEYTWDSEVLRFELEADGHSSCRLIFTNIFDDRGAAAALGSGWLRGLDLLEAHLNGRAVDGSTWEQLQADYNRALG